MTQPLSKSFKLKRAYDLAFAPNAKRVATISRNVLFWDASTRKQLCSVHPLAHPSHLDFSPDGTRLAVKSTSGRIVVVDADAGRTLTDCDNELEGEGASLCFVPGGEYLVDASWSGVLTVRHAASGAVVSREEAGSMVSDLTASTDRAAFAYVSCRLPATSVLPPSDDSIMIRHWPFAINRPRRISLARRFIRCISLSPSASRLAVLHGAPPTTIEICDVVSARVLASARVEVGGSGRAVAWSPDGSLLGCVERGGIVLFRSDSLLRTHFIPLSYPASVSFSPDGELLGLASWEQGRVLDVAELEPYAIHANLA